MGAKGALKTVTKSFLYDFAALGGGQEALVLTDLNGNAQTLPDNAVITEVVVEGVTDNTSGGAATIALGYVGEATAFLGATAFNNAMWNVNAVTVGAPTVAVGKTTAAVSVIATVADADLTAGKWCVHVSYIAGL
tara:strand:- start:6887 stop:7291 length:405 start_codon:yes stop_codon:yes gene_type:complete